MGGDAAGGRRATGGFDDEHEHSSGWLVRGTASRAAVVGRSASPADLTTGKTAVLAWPKKRATAATAGAVPGAGAASGPKLDR
jgi:hypothetical protein